MRAARVVSIACVIALTSVACTGSNSEDLPKKRRSTTQTTKPKGPGCRFIVANEARRHQPPADHLEYLNDAFAEPNVCYDKITFVFDRGNGSDAPPGYTVEYKEGPFTEGPNNNSVETLGTAFLVVTFEPTSQTDGRLPGRAITTYKGNLRLRLEGMRHTEIVRKLIDQPDSNPEDLVADDKVAWIIGLDVKRPFTVDAANQPPRVSVLIMN